MNDSRLAIVCARPRQAWDLSSEMEDLIHRGVNWESFIRRVEKEGTATLAYQRLKSMESIVPAEILEKLQRIYFWNSVRNLSLYALLKPLADAVSRAGLMVVVTKGARLALDVYGDPGLRPFADIDVTVHRRDWPPFRDVLQEQRFRADEAFERYYSQDSVWRDWTFRPLYRKEKLTLEVHFDYLGLQIPFSSEEDLWASTGRLEWEGAALRVLSPEYELCYLCCHSQQHSYSRLIWLTDIAELASCGRMDWAKVHSICRREFISASIYHGLFLAESLWPGTVPQKAFDGLTVTKMEKRCLRFCWPMGDVVAGRTRAAFPYYAPTLFSLRARKRMGLTLKTVAHVFFPSRTWMAYSYGLNKRSLRIYGLYGWRLLKPFLALGKRVTRFKR